MLPYYCLKFNSSITDNYYSSDMDFIKRLTYQILKSKVIITTFNSMAYYQEVTYPFSQNQFIDELWQHLYFVPIHNLELNGFTDSNNLNIYINNLPNRPNACNDDKYPIKNSVIYILNLGIIIVTLVHEILGHYMKRYINFQLNKKKYNSYDESKFREGGLNIENILFNKAVREMSLPLACFLLNEKNWEKKREDFKTIIKKLKSMSLEEQLNIIKKECKQSFIRNLLNKNKIVLNELSAPQLPHLTIPMSSNCSNGNLTLSLGRCFFEINRIAELLNN